MIDLSYLKSKQDRIPVRICSYIDLHISPTLELTKYRGLAKLNHYYFVAKRKKINEFNLNFDHHRLKEIIIGSEVSLSKNGTIYATPLGAL